MDGLILLVIVFWFANPKWMGRHVYRIQYWQKYYEINSDDEHYNNVVRHRALNIKRIRHAKFKALK